MIFQYDFSVLEPILIQRVLIGLEAILEKYFSYQIVQFSGVSLILHLDHKKKQFFDNIYFRLG